MDMKNDPLFSSENKARSHFFKWGKPGDNFKGTLLRTEMKPNPNKKGELSPSYEFKAQYGSFHHFEKNDQGVVITDEDSTSCEEGEIWTLGTLYTVDKALKHVKPGTIIGMHFKELIQGKDKTKNPTKVVEVYIGGQDPSYMGEGADDLPNFNN